MAGHLNARRVHRGHRPGRADALIGWAKLLLDALRGDRPLWRRADRHGKRRRAPQHAERQSWFARRDVSVARAVSIGAVAVAVCIVAWSIVAKTGAFVLAASDPKAALALNSSSSTALNSFAGREIAAEQGNLDAAVQALHKALRHAPLDEQALYLLSRAARRRNDAAASDALLHAAAERSWRNLAVQITLAENDLARQKYGDALEHIDAAIRMEPDLQHQDNHVLGVLAAYLLNPVSLRSLEQFLGSAPPWREWLLEKLCGRLVKREPLDALYASLAASANPPTHAERLAYVGRLVQDGRYREAQKEWAAGLSGGVSATAATVPYNRDFKATPDGSPFDWKIVADHGAEVRLNAGAANAPGGLTAQFSGSRVDMNVGQLQILPPGRYIFGGEVTARNLAANRGVRWRLYCANAPQQDLAATDLVTSAMGWTRFSAQFEVPAQGCPAQWLRLEIPARVPSEREIEGQISYRSLAIDPVDDKSGLQLLWRWPAQ